MVEWGGCLYHLFYIFVILFPYTLLLLFQYIFIYLFSLFSIFPMLLDLSLSWLVAVVGIGVGW